MRIGSSWMTLDWRRIGTGLALNWHRIGMILAINCGILHRLVNDRGLAVEWRNIFLWNRPPLRLVVGPYSILVPRLHAQTSSDSVGLAWSVPMRCRLVTIQCWRLALLDVWRRLLMDRWQIWPIGGGLAMDRHRIFTGLQLNWLLIDIMSAPNWHKIGAALAIDWYCIGKGLALDWPGIDVALAQDSLDWH